MTDRRFTGMWRHWRLDPGVVQLNHGGFGAVPWTVLDEQRRWRDAMERNPTDFLTRRLPALLDGVRRALAGFLGCDPAGLVFVPNATAGVQTALASVRLGAGDEILTTDQCYNAVRVQLTRAAAATGARLRVVPVPVDDEDTVTGAVLAGLTPRTRVLVLDHVTSPTGAVLPVRRVAAACRARGVITVVDGAHALAMLPVDVAALGVDFWTGNLHKWLCAPKTAAVLWVAPEHRGVVRPLVVSHDYEAGLHAAFDWTGTYDPSPLLAARAALDFFAGLGWDDVRRHNRELAGLGARLVAEALGTSVPVPDGMAGAMRVAALPEPLEPADARRVEAALLHDHGVEVPLTGGDAMRWVRISAQVYNEPDDCERLAEALPKALAVR